MKSQLNNLAMTSMLFWFDNKLLTKVEAFTNHSSYFWPIDVNYYGPGSNIMVFYDYIDLKYLESKSNISNSNSPFCISIFIKLGSNASIV